MSRNSFCAFDVGCQALLENCISLITAFRAEERTWLPCSICQWGPCRGLLFGYWSAKLAHMQKTVKQFLSKGGKTQKGHYFGWSSRKFFSVAGMINPYFYWLFPSDETSCILCEYLAWIQTQWQQHHWLFRYVHVQTCNEHLINLWSGCIVPEDVASHFEAFRGGSNLSVPHYPYSPFLPLPIAPSPLAMCHKTFHGVFKPASVAWWDLELRPLLMVALAKWVWQGRSSGTCPITKLCWYEDDLLF